MNDTTNRSRGSHARCGLYAALVAVVLPAALSAAAGGKDTDSDWVRGLAQQAVEHGNPARLSPHLSVLLGVSATQQDMPVHQLGIREDSGLWLFDVCDNDHSRVVLMHVVHESQVQAYRVSTHGHMLAGVAYAVGGDTHVIAPGSANQGFDENVQFWRAQWHKLGAMP